MPMDIHDIAPPGDRASDRICASVTYDSPRGSSKDRSGLSGDPLTPFTMPPLLTSRMYMYFEVPLF